MSLALVIAGTIVPPPKGVRLELAEGGTGLDLPWWPDSIDHSGLAPTYTDTERPGRASVSTRSGEPLETLRMTFVLSQRDLADSAAGMVAAIRRMAQAKPLVRVLLGSDDRGTWQVRDAGYSETAHADDGQVAEAEVTLELRKTASAVTKVGPIATRPRR